MEDTANGIGVLNMHGRHCKCYQGMICKTGPDNAIGFLRKKLINIHIVKSISEHMK